MSGPCTPWLSDEEALGCCLAKNGVPIPEGADPAVYIDPQVLQDAVDVATEILWALSGRQFSGPCDIDVSLCGCDCGCETSCGCKRGCHPSFSLDLRRWAPVQQVTAVTVEGSVVPVTDYRLVRHRWLQRVDGTDWARCVYEENHLVVAMTVGKPPPGSAKRAVEALVCYLMQDCTQGCGTLDRARSVVRQGISIDVATMDETLMNDMLGIKEVDLFLRLYNPQRGRHSSFVYTPDLVPSVVR